MSKKVRLFISLTLALSFVIASGVTNAAASDVVFLGANFIQGKGLLVTLKVPSGTGLDTPAYVVLDGVKFDLDCKVIETQGTSDTLHCVAAMGKPEEGASATIWFGSDSFTTTLKESRPWCYSVFDFTSGATSWETIYTYCQAHTAGVGTKIVLGQNPGFGGDWIYVYQENGYQAPNCGTSQSDLGNGFYYNCGLPVP